MYLYRALSLLTTRFRYSHFVKSMGVLVYLLVFQFLFIPFFLPFLGFNMKSRFMNNGFLSDQAHAMDFDPTEPGRSSLDRVRPGFPLSKESDISDVWGGISPFNDSDLSSFESNEGGGLEAGPSESRCKKAALRCYKPTPYSVERLNYSIEKFEKRFEERLKAKNEEKYRQSEIYTVLKPMLGSELSKTYTSNTISSVKILRFYTLPTSIPNICWEKAAEALLGKENESVWNEKIKELRQQRKESAFYKSAAEWLIQINMERGGSLKSLG